MQARNGLADQQSLSDCPSAMQDATSCSIQAQTSSSHYHAEPLLASSLDADLSSAAAVAVRDHHLSFETFVSATLAFLFPVGLRITAAVAAQLTKYLPATQHSPSSTAQSATSRAQTEPSSCSF